VRQAAALRRLAAGVSEDFVFWICGLNSAK